MELISQYVKYLMKHSTPQRPLWNIELLNDHGKARWNYVDGCMIKAILELYYITGEQDYFDFANSFIDHYVDDDGIIMGYNIEEFNIDNINEGKVLFDLYKVTGKEKYRKAIEYVQEQVKSQPRTKTNNFWHKKIYPNQIWLDGLYMVQPFYMEYETTFNNKSNYADILDQFRTVYKFMRDPKTKLLYHGFDETKSMFWANRKTGCSPSFWLRSLGWYAMALIDTIEKMDKKDLDAEPILVSMLQEFIYAILEYQDPQSDMWFQVTDRVGDPGNYLETSGSAMIAYAVLKASRLGYIDEKYHERGVRCFDGIRRKYLRLQNDALELGGICLVAGLGGSNGKGNYQKRDGSFEYYISEPVVNNDAKGVAPFLLAYTEILRTQKSVLNLAH